LLKKNYFCSQASASCASIEVNITKGEEQVATSELSVPKVRQDELILEEKTSETPAASLDTDLGIPLTLNKKPLGKYIKCCISFKVKEIVP